MPSTAVMITIFTGCYTNSIIYLKSIFALLFVAFKSHPNILFALVMTRGRNKLHRGVLKLVLRYLSEVKMLEANGSVFLDCCYLFFSQPLAPPTYAMNINLSAPLF